MTTSQPCTCAHCGAADAELTEFNGRFYCPVCLDALTLVCTDCGTRFLRSRNCSENDAFPVCPDCYNRNYTHCTRCGALIHTNACYYPYDNDDPYCQSCCREIDSCAIHEYGYKPEAIFYGQGDRFFGVELEIDGGGEYTDNAESILSIANREQNLIYCKHDGSLDEGFEIVTHPMSLDFQLHKMPWQAVLQKAIAMGYLSHQAGTCGLHVHVSRDAFGDTGDAQDKAIARVLFFVERHWNELLRFSRRSQHQMDRWAARYGYRDHPDEMLEHIKKGYGNRYTCVNLTNEDTVEFRMFRGTLKWNTLIATLQMVNRICDAAIYLPDEELRSLSWSSFVSGNTEPELIRYLKERDLYCLWHRPTPHGVQSCPGSRSTRRRRKRSFPSHSAKRCWLQRKTTPSCIPSSPRCCLPVCASANCWRSSGSTSTLRPVPSLLPNL